MSDPSQFEDAVTPTTPTYAAPRQPGVTYIDDAAAAPEQPVGLPQTEAEQLSEQIQQQLVWDDYPDGVDEDDEEEIWDESEEEEEEMMRRGEVNDEDWEGAERDFSKQYNRLRQYHNVTSGANSNSASASKTTTKPASGSVPLPALNRPRRPPPTKPSANPAVQATGGDQHSQNPIILSRLLNLDPYAPGPSVNRKAASEKANMKDKADRATQEQVLDPRTRLVLVKMLNRGVLRKVEGCVSTGKEANVYHALPGLEPLPATPSNPHPVPLPPHIALKIYKTSILVFKDRDRYVTGEHRFRNGYGKGNPRKMVRMWAEKEMRNLKRLENEGVRCPRPIEVRENVLAMEFLGDDEGWASPRLKDAPAMDMSALADLYAELMLIMRVMYQRCRLVHADLSEYNILYHESHLYIIDVSQSVEHDHPSSYDFLRSDIRNVMDFFKKLSKGEVRTLGARKTFEFVTREDIGSTWDGGAEKKRFRSGEDKREKGEVDEEMEGWERVLREWVDSSEGGVVDDESEDETAPAGPGATTTSATGLPILDEDSLANPFANPLASFNPSTSSQPASISRPSTSSSSAMPKSQAEIDQAQDEAIFLSSYIPRNLSEVYDPERDVELVKRGEGGDLIYARSGGVGIVGVDAEGRKKGVKFDGIEEAGEEGESEEDDESGSDDGEEGGEEFEKGAPRGKRHEDREAKKERKKALKEETREKRKEKIPKKEKKKKIKATTSKQ